ncbi:hypothetical protein PIN31009_04894 [Pandoraea iniqua]|uniref:DUF4422 domain-containing protein n=1 Tax=Pandoraea iniqua TaxID=2508288 RepID=UPI001242BD4C|nr:DUF4422 domain-containing protein [Pandoraea iniqua]VVE54534.1 hypothetical protein PIN31009_04894 [Pandoraea iniqua]
MNKEEEIKLLCLYHNKALINTERDFLFNIQCGRSAMDSHLPMSGDDVGDNISSRNQFWSEITGIYWAWKHLPKVPYIGVCSYRRFFNFDFGSSKPIEIISLPEGQKFIDNYTLPSAHELFKDADIITPVPYTYAYSIARVCSMNYNDADFEILESVVGEKYPDYMDSYRDHMYENNKMIGHNMFIMSWENFTRYCEWVFDILLEVERRIDPTNYPIHQIRVFGYMHELLLEIYIKKNKLRTKTSPLLWVESTVKKTHFNSLRYRIAANVYYMLDRAIHRNYQHRAKKKLHGS